MDKLKQEKLKMWKKQEADLQKELAETMQSRGKAAAEGDLSENAAYSGFTDDAQLISARLDVIQKMIKGLEERE